MKSVSDRVTLRTIAERLDISIGTVSRALHDHPRTNQETKRKVLALAASIGYSPNLAARFLVSKKTLRIGVNSPREIAYFYDAIRRGLDDEARTVAQTGVELQHRFFPRLGEGEVEAFEQALEANLDGLIVVPGDLASLRAPFRRAERRGIPLICLATDAPDLRKIASVTINTHSMGALAADLMGRFTGGRGKLAITSGNLQIADHIEKFKAFEDTLARHFPSISLLPPLENQEVQQIAYEQVVAILAKHPDLTGIYISTGNGSPVLRAIQEAKPAGGLTIVSTDIFEDAVPHIRSGTIAATLYERPYSQGRSAFRLMYEYLVEGKTPEKRVAFEPLLIMRSNVESFVRSAAPHNRRRNEDPSGSRSLIDELVLSEQCK